MKKITFITLICFQFFTLFSQEKGNKDSLENIFFNASKTIYDRVMATKNIDLLDSMILETKKHNVSKQIAFNYAQKGTAIFEINQDSLFQWEDKNPKYQKILSEINGNFEKAINTCSECGIKWRYERFTILERLRENKNPIYMTDLEALKSAGYKKERKGVGLGAHLIQGKNTWYGFNFALVKLYQPHFKLKTIDSETNKPIYINKEMNFSLSLLGFNYAYAPKIKKHDMSIELIKFDAPIYISPLQIGWQYWETKEKNYGFYRPEIGIGYGGFSISYAYTLMFNKSLREEAEKHLLLLRYNYPFIKFE